MSKPNSLPQTRLVVNQPERIGRRCGSWRCGGIPTGKRSYPTGNRQIIFSKRVKIKQTQVWSYERRGISDKCVWKSSFGLKNCWRGRSSNPHSRRTIPQIEKNQAYRQDNHHHGTLHLRLLQRFPRQFDRNPPSPQLLWNHQSQSSRLLRYNPIDNCHHHQHTQLFPTQRYLLCRYSECLLLHQQPIRSHLQSQLFPSYLRSVSWIFSTSAHWLACYHIDMRHQGYINMERRNQQSAFEKSW